MSTPKLHHLVLVLTCGLVLVLWTACGVQGPGNTDEFENGSLPPATRSSGSPAQNPDDSSGDVCMGSEEGMFNCASGVPGDGTGGTVPGDGSGGSNPDDGSATGTTPGSGTGTNPGDGSGTGGDCPEEGCPDDGSSGGTTNPGSGTSTNPGGGSGSVPPVCDEETFNPSSTAEADLLLVVDRSGSMDEVPQGAANTKWEQVREVITGVTAELDDTYGFGLMFYPAGSGEALQCVGGSVVVDMADANGPAIANAFWSTGPGGGTPTAATLRVAGAHLHNRVTTRPQAVVLATDGAPNCNASADVNSCVCSQSSNCSHSFACLDDSNTVAAVQALAQDGIATFVVGIPGSELFAGVLDGMAVAGGTAVSGVHKYYDAGSQQALEAALRQIGRRVSMCRFELQNAPLSTTVAVTVDGTAESRDQSRVNGWDYVGARTIEFFGPACQALGSGSSVVRVEYCAVPAG
ncbi:MAG: vWA domain-containing protein [Pseudomonadota bacterium]